MGWTINCCDAACNQASWAENIVDLIENHRTAEGWIRCAHCGGEGYIEKSFDLQEPGETWEPYLKGIIPLGNPEDVYQPFVFLVSYEHHEAPNDIWFSYYKDTRPIGGRLKLGYGPGGPPVLGVTQVLTMLRTLVQLGCVAEETIVNAVRA